MFCREIGRLVCLGLIFCSLAVCHWGSC